MATYLGNGQYNLLDVINRSKDPSINYDGLYEDPSRDQGSYTSNPFKAATSSDFEYLNSKSLKSRDRRDQYNIFSPYDVPVNQRMRMDNMSYLNDTPLRNSYGGPQSSQFDNFDPRIGRPEVVSDFVAGDDGMYIDGNYPDNPYPDNTELGNMTGLVTDQFYDQMDKAPTMTDTIENNQYDVNNAALGIMENAFNQRQIMADETSVGNYPMEPVMGNINGVKSNAPLTSADYERMDPSLLEEDQIGMTAGDLQNRQGILQVLQDKMGGLKDFLPFGDKSLSGMAVKGIKGIGSGLRSLFQRNPNAPSYQGNDFYDSNEDSDTFGTTRFDRAVPGSFASFRTLSGYLNRNKNAAAALTTKKAKKEAAMQQQIKDAQARQAVLDARQAAADRSRQSYNPGNIGGGSYRSDRDNSRDGGYGGSSQRSKDNRSSDLGFSDIRLKDNIELVGKSPSDINIYNFTYLNDPKVYQGVMAQEVPWASVKHDSGYLMVDYSKVDVEFKRKDAVASMFTRRR